MGDEYTESKLKYKHTKQIRKHETQEKQTVNEANCKKKSQTSVLQSSKLEFFSLVFLADVNQGSNILRLRITAFNCYIASIM